MLSSLATDHKSEFIDDYFKQNAAWSQTGGNIGEALHFVGSGDERGWKVTVAFSGDETETGGRVSRCARFLDSGSFFVTYATDSPMLTSAIYSHFTQNRIGSRLEPLPNQPAALV
jgi:hypothetical protein